MPGLWAGSMAVSPGRSVHKITTKFAVVRYLAQ